MNFFSIVLVFIFYFVSIILKSKKDQKKIIGQQNRPSTHTPPRRVKTERPKEATEKSIFEEIEERVQGYKEKLSPAPPMADEEEQIKKAITERRETARKAPFYNEAKEEETSPIYRQEIGGDISIRFDEDTVLKGIIMSEVLSKPKSMRK